MMDFSAFAHRLAWWHPPEWDRILQCRLQLPLQNAASGLVREKFPDTAIGFFLHIPFPSYEVFRLLPRPWRTEIIDGLLGAGLIGFHTHDYARDFLTSVLRTVGYEHHLGDLTLRVTGRPKPSRQEGVTSTNIYEAKNPRPVRFRYSTFCSFLLESVM